MRSSPWVRRLKAGKTNTTSDNLPALTSLSEAALVLNLPHSPSGAAAGVSRWSPLALCSSNRAWLQSLIQYSSASSPALLAALFAESTFDATVARELHYQLSVLQRSTSSRCKPGFSAFTQFNILVLPLLSRYVELLQRMGHGESCSSFPMSHRDGRRQVESSVERKQDIPADLQV